MPLDNKLYRFGVLTVTLIAVFGCGGAVFKAIVLQKVEPLFVFNSVVAIVLVIESYRAVNHAKN